MAFNTVRRLAADIMSVGENRIRFATDKLADIKTDIAKWAQAVKLSGAKAD